MALCLGGITAIICGTEAFKPKAFSTDYYWMPPLRLSFMLLAEFPLGSSCLCSGANYFQNKSGCESVWSFIASDEAQPHSGLLAAII